MVIKNKLYKHHKSKYALFIRDLSIAFSSFLALVAIIAIPTYFSTKNNTEVKANEQTQNSEVDSGENNENQPLEHYEEK